MSTQLAPNIQSTLKVLNDFTEVVLRALPNASDDQLTAYIQDANTLANTGFIIRGAAACEAAQRIEKRGGDLGRELSRLAKEAQVEPGTIKEDRSIFETYGVEALRGPDALSREFYRRALAAPDPLAAIEMAHAKKASTNDIYSTKDFSGDVKRLNGGEDIEKVAKDIWFKFKPKDGNEKVIYEGAKRQGKTVNDFLNDLVEGYADAYLPK